MKNNEIKFNGVDVVENYHSNKKVKLGGKIKRRMNYMKFRKSIFFNRLFKRDSILNDKYFSEYFKNKGGVNSE